MADGRRAPAYAPPPIFPVAPTLAVAIATANWSAAAHAILVGAADTIAENGKEARDAITQAHEQETAGRSAR